jgi:hypothetical protein
LNQRLYACNLTKHSLQILAYPAEEKIAEGCEYQRDQALLLDSLLPFFCRLLLLVTVTGKEMMKNKNSAKWDPEIYVTCLAQLSAFDDYNGSFWKNEAPMVHPTIPSLSKY